MERYLNLWAESLPQLLGSTLAVTIPLSLISFALALLVGIISAGARTSRFAPVNWLAWLYIWVFRGTPLLVQLFIVFYGLPKVGIALDVWSAADHHDEPAHRRVRGGNLPFRGGGYSARPV